MTFKRIILTGSLAYDRIYKIDKEIKNEVSFISEEYQVQHGGTAGNIAYSLGKLDVQCTIVGAIGFDGGKLKENLINQKHNAEFVQMFEDQATAHACIFNFPNEQYTIFHPGALKNAPLCNLPKLNKNEDLVVISPNSISAMMAYANICVSQNVPYICDTGQITGYLQEEELKFIVMNSYFCIFNENEHKIPNRIVNWEKYKGIKIVTLGDQGAFYTLNKQTFLKPLSKKVKVLDTTGAGDAFRAGIIFGLKEDKSIEESIGIGNSIASLCVQSYGGQGHEFYYTGVQVLNKHL